MFIPSESIANLAVATMCLVVAYAVADRYILTRRAPTDLVGGYRPGDPFTASPEQVGLQHSRLSAVIVVSNNCRFCAESAAFYQRLIALQKGHSRQTFQTVFLGMAGEADAAAFVAAYDLGPGTVRPTPADVTSRIPGTPTLLLVDAKGRVASTWVGKLSEAEERSVLSTVSETLQTY